MKELFLAGNFHIIELCRTFILQCSLTRDSVILVLFLHYYDMAILKSSDTAAVASRALRFVFAAVMICNA